MKLELYKKPKNPVVIQGFPGFGLVGTITTEFLIEHLKTEQIGKIHIDEMPAMVAIHKQKLVEPVTIHYNKKYNLIIVHAITSPTHFEWGLAEQIHNLCKQVGAKELVCAEGVNGDQGHDHPQVYHYATDEKLSKKLKKIGVDALGEGVIIGVTSALISTKKTAPITSLFVETHSQLPDSKAAASIIQTLDKYLGLAVDYKPLLEQAKAFEDKLKLLLSKSQEAQESSEKKRLSYLG